MEIVLKPTIDWNRYKVMIDQIIVGEAWHYNFGGWTATWMYNNKQHHVTKLTEEELLQTIESYERNND